MTQAARLYVCNGKTMGTVYEVKFVTSKPVDEQAIAHGVQETVQRVDGQMSTWKPDSELSRFNRSAPGDWFPVPSDLARVVQAGLEIGRLSAGAFDVTVGSLVNLWGFGPVVRSPSMPDEQAVSAAAAVVGYENLEARLDPPALRKAAQCFVDLSGIAKGFGVDQIARYLEHRGILDSLVCIDGEVRVAGCKPGPEGSWLVAVEAPKAHVRELWDVLSPKDCSMATSGDYRHFREFDGQHFSHTIDRRTGQPVRNAVGSVTVAHPECMLADAWATALLVLGPQAGVALANAHGIAALFLVRADAEIVDITTGDFAAVIG